MAEQLNWYLSFTGYAEDRLDGNKTRQYGTGSLKILNTNGTEVASFEAISGPGINGLLPNGKYKATRFTLDNDFPDEFGLSYKISIDPVGALAAGFNRSALRIHPVQLRYKSQNLYIPSPTDGCIGLVGHKNSEPFMNYMKQYFQQYDSIDLEVDIVGNANVKIQLNDKLTYA